jgi:hypothetical protein
MMNLPDKDPKSQRLALLLKIMVFVLLLIGVLLLTGYLKKIMLFVNPDIENCKGGSCRDSCIKDQEIMNNNAACSDTSKVCCVINDRTPSAECVGYTKGYVCGRLMICDADLVCVSRCDYCAQNPDDKACVIDAEVVTIGASVTKFDDKFTCGCTEMDCNSFDNSKLGTCVKGFCPSDVPVATNYMCCVNPYKK